MSEVRANVIGSRKNVSGDENTHNDDLESICLDLPRATARVVPGMVLWKRSDRLYESRVPMH